jgi:hypothetical protein
MNTCGSTRHASKHDQGEQPESSCLAFHLYFREVVQVVGGGGGGLVDL